MTANEMLELMGKMENREKNRFLDKLYDDYFDKGIPYEILEEQARILRLYSDGYLVESEGEHY